MAFSWVPDPDDFDVVDGSEDVTYLRVEPDGNVTAYAGVAALPEYVIRMPAGDAGGAQMTQRQATWHVKGNAVPFVPDRGDRIVSASGTFAGTWVIQDVERVRYSLLFTCRCIRLEDRPS